MRRMIREAMPIPRNDAAAPAKIESSDIGFASSCGEFTQNIVSRFLNSQFQFHWRFPPLEPTCYEITLNLGAADHRITLKTRIKHFCNNITDGACCKPLIVFC